ncbi:hypothetical protein IJD44_00185 [bacterium]|nr:hypothetical protein [bacterium]
MHKFTLQFSVMFLLLAVLMLFSVIYFNMPMILTGNKLVLFALLNALMIVGVGIFFVVFKERIFLYFENYRREKQI